MSQNFTKDFVEKIAKEPITDFTIKPGSKIGDNVAGEIKALKIQTKSGKTLDLVVKTLPETESSFVEYMRAMRIFALEIGVYTTVRSDLEKLIQSHHQNFTIPLPEYFGGICDGVSDFLCLKDMRAEGFKMLDKYAGLGFPEVKLVMEELGRFHATAHALIKHEGEKYFEECGIPQLSKNIFSDQGFTANMAGLYAENMEFTVRIIKERDPEVGEMVRKAYDLPSSKMLKIMTSIMGQTDLEIFPTIIHGDFWMNNILFKYDEGGRPTDLRFIDFQQCRRGNVLEELIYFFFTSTTPDFRAEHLATSLKIYYDSFTGTLKLLKCPVPWSFSLGSFLDRFYDGFLYAFLFMTFAIPLQLGNLENPYETPENEKTLMSSGRLRHLMEGSPRACERITAIAQEMARLQVF